MKKRGKTFQVVLYGALLASLIFLLKWLELRFIIINHSQEIFTGASCVDFHRTGDLAGDETGTSKNGADYREKEVVVRAGEFVFNEMEAERRGLSRRELEVLQLMSEGLSNQEIADKLFVSNNTVKTHSRNLFEKLDVVRRTQAVQKGKELNLIA